jgi:hypothetical protein
MFPWVKIPDRVYDAAIRAAMNEQGKVFGLGRADLFDRLGDADKEKARRIWRVGFSALLRAWL